MRNWEYIDEFENNNKHCHGYAIQGHSLLGLDLLRHFFNTCASIETEFPER
jgi:hypothetical protein